MSVLASGAIVQQTLLAHGEYGYEIMPQLQPVPTAVHELGNPWISYSVYLNNTFIPGMLQIMILLTTVFSIGTEIKHGTSREWLARSHNSVVLAITGKLLPQTVLFFIMGALLQSMLYGYWHFPLHNGIWPMLAAMFLLVLASQSFGVIMMSIAPSLRIGLSIAALFGIISISITGFIPRACHVSAISVIVEYIPATTLFPDIRRSSVERHTIILQPNALSVFVPFCHSFFTVIETTQNRFAKSSICSLAISRIKKY